jgi:exopolysaccharide production protein ExoZ
MSGVRLVSSTPTGATIVNIQALRAIAALLVMCVHMATFGALLGWQPRATAFGNCGVDLFFVISGFIMMHTVTYCPTTARAFLRNRIVRVVPLYWLTTLALFALAMTAPALLGDTRADWRALLLSLAFIPFDRGGGVVEPLFFLGWTLNYEMFFYACFALALWVARGRPMMTQLGCAGAIAACVCIGWLLAPTGFLSRFYTNDIMLEFVFGMAAARIAFRCSVASRLVAVAMVLGGLLFMLWIAPSLPVPRWTTSGVAATVLLLGAVWGERGGLGASARVVQAVGAASYALYLTHPFVLQAFGKLAERSGRGHVAVVALAITGSIAAIVAALLVHKTVELPITHALRRAVGHRRTVVEAGDPLAAKDRDKLVSTH